MCANQVRYRGETLTCGTTLTRLDTNGVRVRETVHCFECIREAALRWRMPGREHCLLESDYDEPLLFHLGEAA